MQATRNSNGKLALLIAGAYVILATIYSYWAVGNSVSDGALFYFFLPASTLPSLIFFSERHPALLILVCQTATTAVLWFLLRALLVVRNDRPEG